MPIIIPQLDQVVVYKSADGKAYFVQAVKSNIEDVIRGLIQLSWSPSGFSLFSVGLQKTTGLPGTYIQLDAESRLVFFVNTLPDGTTSMLWEEFEIATNLKPPGGWLNPNVEPAPFPIIGPETNEEEQKGG